MKKMARNLQTKFRFVSLGLLSANFHYWANLCAFSRVLMRLEMAVQGRGHIVVDYPSQQQQTTHLDEEIECPVTGQSKPVDEQPDALVGAKLQQIDFGADSGHRGQGRHAHGAGHKSLVAAGKHHGPECDDHDRRHAAEGPVPMGVQQLLSQGVEGDAQRDGAQLDEGGPRGCET